MNNLVLYTIIAFAIGFGIAWIIRSAALAKCKRVLTSTEGFLESERLKKETLKNENQVAHQQKQITEIALGAKLADARNVIKQMDEDILLMQKSNEETEQQLEIVNPELSALKKKLIEANNSIARYKSQLGGK